MPKLLRQLPIFLGLDGLQESYLTRILGLAAKIQITLVAIILLLGAIASGPVAGLFILLISPVFFFWMIGPTLMAIRLFKRARDTRIGPFLLLVAVGMPVSAFFAWYRILGGGEAQGGIAILFFPAYQYLALLGVWLGSELVRWAQEPSNDG